MRKKMKALRRAIAVVMTTAAAGATATMLSAGTSSAATPGSLEICHGPDYALKAEFQAAKRPDAVATYPYASTEETPLIHRPWREQNCKTYRLNLTNGEKITIYYVIYHGPKWSANRKMSPTTGSFSPYELMTVGACGGGHKIWTEGNNVKSLSCGRSG